MAKLSKEKQNLLKQAAQKKLLNFAQLTNSSYEATWFHELIADKLEEILYKVQNKQKARLIITVPPRHGKQCASNTLVPTPTGFKRHGDLRVNDTVFSHSGEQIKIKNIIPQTELATMKVTMTDGSSVLVHPNHEWTVHDRMKRGAPLVTIETKEMMKSVWIGQKGIRGSRSRWQLPDRNVIQFDEQPIQVDPYTLGCWLGDGSAGKPALTLHPDDLEDIVKNIPYEISTICTHKDTKIQTVYFSGPKPGVSGELTKGLQRLNIYKKKSIPQEYIFNTEEVRRELLAGLIDTDGSIGNDKRVRFINANKDIIDNAALLIRSLGYRTTITSQEPSMSSSGIQGKQRVYTISFTPTDDKFYTKLKRKNKNVGSGIKRKIAIASIQEVSGQKGECIEVDSPDGLYLVTDHFIPTHNSELASVLFPAWALGKVPNLQIILSTYGAELAEKMGLKTRDLINSEAFKAVFSDIHLRADVKAKAKWMTNKGGSYTGVGLGGAITGTGGDIIIIDDLVKSREEAESKTVQNTAWEYYRSTLYSRLEGYGAVIVIMQRWNQSDLVAMLKRQEEELRESGEEFDHWDIINFPAIAQEDEYDENHKLLRKQGEALWPSKFPIESLHNIRSTQGLYHWSSQYLQDPIHAETQEFKEHLFKKYDEGDLEGKYLSYYTFVDPAISQAEEADNTVVTTIAKEVYGPNIYRIKEDAGKFTPMQTIDLIFQHQSEYRSQVYLETIAYQKALKYSIIEEQKKKQQYFTVHETKPTKKKEFRIRGLLPLYEAGVIHHKHSDYEYEQELLAFPRGRHDDRIDAMASFVEVADTAYQGEAGQIRPKKKFISTYRKRR